jgi:SDR family mycofactocin-dependent oxidoreductase
MERFNGRVAFITGVARGQGREHAVRLAAEGASIIGLDSCAPPATTTYEPATEADLAVTVAAVEAAGGRMVGRVADVRDAAAVQAVVDEGVATLGGLDHVIANAAVCSYGRLWELTPEQWTETVDVNLTGVWHTLRATVPTLIEQGRGGSIVITSSGAGLKGLPLLGHYGATKWAITGMARSLANEVGEHSIRVNTVHPTAVRTPMGDDPGLRAVLGAHAHLARSFGNMLPTGKIEAADVSDAVLWLLSEEARWVTGAAIPVDAGASQV